MTAAEAIADALASTGLPFTMWAWPTGAAPALPWCVWCEEDHGESYADNRNYASHPTMRVELYQRETDPDVTAAVREALRAIAPTSEYSTWIDSEGCEVTYFTLTYPFGGD